MFLKQIANGWKVGSLANMQRQKRMDFLVSLLQEWGHQSSILDVGGTEQFWHSLTTSSLKDAKITLLNLEERNSTDARFTYIQTDARLVPFHDKSFDLVFSNSVIEHVGGLREQRAMAQEVQRVGKHFFVQTPNRKFFMEPHFLFPFFQFLPLHVRALLHARISLGWWRKAESFHSALEEVESIRLCSYGDLKYLFLGATIWREKFWGMTKSFVVYS